MAEYSLRVGQNGAFIVGDSDGDALLWDAATRLWRPGSVAGQVTPLARAWYVDADRASSSPDGSIAAPYRTIQAAVNAIPVPTTEVDAETAWLVLIAPSIGLYGEDIVLPPKQSVVLQSLPRSADASPASVVLASLTWAADTSVGNPVSGIVGVTVATVTLSAPDEATEVGFCLSENASAVILDLGSHLYPYVLADHADIDGVSMAAGVLGVANDSYVGTVLVNYAQFTDSAAGLVTLAGESPSVVASNTTLDGIEAPAGSSVALDSFSSGAFAANHLDPSINPIALDRTALQYREAIVTVAASATPVVLDETPQVSLLVVQGTATQAVTLPTAATMSPTSLVPPRFSRVFTVVNQSTLATTVSPADGDSIDGGDIVLTTGQTAKFAVRADTAWVPF